MRRSNSVFAALTLTASLFAAGCGGEIDVGNDIGASEYDLAFQAAGREFGVPPILLKAIGWAETRLHPITPTAGDIESMAPAHGVMALRGDALTRGAALAGVSVEDAKVDNYANIRAAAALLRAYSDELHLDKTRLGAWAPAVARLSGIGDADAQADHVHNAVYRALRVGVPGEERTGMRDILPALGNIDIDYPLPAAATTRQAQGIYAGSIWRPAPSSNYTVGRGGYGVELVVIHTCAGAYSGCWGWLTTPYPTNPYQTSAHYVVNESGTEVSALVDENNTAHHCGAWWQGLPTNSRSVGIEHGGQPYSGSNVWSEGQIAKSAALTCDVVKRYGIVRDRNHIIGHYQPDPVNRANDPGTSFPWADYMNRINNCVGGGTTITVDSNNANNNSSVARMLAPSSNWVSSTNVAGYYGTGYWVAPTAAVSDGAHFEFYLSAAATKSVYAWWTSASDRTTSAPYVIFNASGTKLGTVYKNQQSGGGAWQSLGSFAFSAGWNRVTVSRWTTSGYQVVADAIQVR